ncbi:MAG TPA: pilin [Rudaea sp.]
MKRIVRLLLGAAVAAQCLGAAAQDKVRSSSDEARLHAQAIANGLSIGAAVQHRVADYYQHFNRFPTSNEDARFGPPKSFASADVQSVTISGDGVITIAMTEAAGVAGGTIVLTPVLSHNTDEHTVDWRCASPSFSTISDDTSGVCSYSKLP